MLYRAIGLVLVFLDGGVCGGGCVCVGVDIVGNLVGF
jgi:hypothetical protein